MLTHPAWACELSSSLSLTPCNPMDCSQLGSSVHEIFQARILEWVAFLFQEIFLNQGWTLCFLPLLRCRWILYHQAIWEDPCIMAVS